MLTDSWFTVLMIVVFYISILLFLFSFCYLLRFIMDKIEARAKEIKRMEQGHKDSVEILSIIEPNELGCDIGEMFKELDKNNINTDFKYKI